LSVVVTQKLGNVVIYHNVFKQHSSFHVRDQAIQLGQRGRVPKTLGMAKLQLISSIKGDICYLNPRRERRLGYFESGKLFAEPALIRFKCLVPQSYVFKKTFLYFRSWMKV